MAGNRVFLDSSVFLTAVLSSSGGSFYLLNKFKERFSFYINEYVFQEVVGVLDRKFNGNSILKNKLFLLLGLTPIVILANPSRDLVGSAAKHVNNKDAPILAGALKSADYLITLDDDFLEARTIKFAKSKKLQIFKPKEFIEKLKKQQ